MGAKVREFATPVSTAYDSDATASDVTMDDPHQAQGEAVPMKRYRDSRAASRNAPYNDDDDDDDDEHRATGKLQLNDDEEVGLMQRDRDGQRTSLGRKNRLLPAWARLSGAGGSSSSSRRYTNASAGCLVFCGVILGFVCGVPLLQWLSSVAPPTTTTPPLSSSNEQSASANTSIWKQPASLNNADGHYGLSNTQLFQLDFQDPGWDTAAEASAGTGLSLQEVTSFKTHDGKDLMPLDMDTVFGGTLVAQTSDLTWSEEDPDQGVFTHVEWGSRDIWLEDVTHARHTKTGQGDVAPFGGKIRLLEGKNVLDAQGQMLSWINYKVSPDMKWVLFFSDEVQQWRYSKHFHLWLHNVAEKQTTPIGSGPSQPSKVAYAAWEPKKQGVSSADPPGFAYVEDNNLFFVPRAGDKAVKATHDGTASIFNAVPDWVYEEEIYGKDYLMWFSPGGSKLVYLRLDETAVPIYEFPIYNPNRYVPGKTTAYSQTTKMKYPKPGYANPIVSVHMIDLDQIKDSLRKGATVRPTQYTLHGPQNDKGKTVNEVDRILSSDAGIQNRLVTEVEWVSDDQLLLRETDRYSDVMRVVLFDLKASSLPVASSDATADVQGKVVRRQDSRADGSGWIRAAQTIEPLSHHDLSIGSTAYLDIVVSPQGYRHVAFFGSATDDRPVFLTEGKWEIDALKHVDAKRGKAYFIAARPTPALRNLYSVDLPDWKSPSAGDKYRLQAAIALTDESKPGSYDANFDPKGAYYVLNYKGPDVPYQKVIGVDDPAFELGLEDNSLLRQISSQYVKPYNAFYQLVLNSTLGNGTAPVTVSVKEIRPHDFDASGRTKYPVLVRVYGGPDSQMVDARWNRADWHQYVATTLGYIVIVIDGRGTGFKGQAYRASVAKQLGKLEAQDVSDAARLISTLPYVDERRMGIWGWSYGGFLTAKAVQLNSGIFSLAVSVAPVTKWQLYDSVYTERYMKSPAENSKGYATSEVQVGSAFSTTKYLLMQGSADDNVHFSHSAHLLDVLTQAKVRGFRFRMFTDSAHSISTRGAYRELYEELTAFLQQHWGAGGQRQPKSSTAKSKNRPSLHNSVEK